MFNFDLQLFGKGGKSGGKLAASLLGFALGFTTPWLFGATAWGAGFMGAALFSSIWSSRNDNERDTGTPTVNRFDRQQESMSSDGTLPVVYGQRMISGNQTYHETNADANTLHKHVVLCEGGIEGVSSVCANGLAIPTGSQTSSTVFTVQNLKHPDATVRLENKVLTMCAGGKTKAITLCNKYDLHSDGNYWDYQVSTSSLVAYINKMGDGWEAFPVATTSLPPGEIKNVSYTNRKDEGLALSNREETKDWKIGEEYHKNGKIYRLLNGQEAYSAYLGGVNEDENKPYSFVWWVPVHVFSEVNGPFGCYKNPANFNIDTVTGGTTYSFHDSTPPENFMETGAYTNMAWLDMTFAVSNELNGNPSVTCMVKGKKVYDTRTGAVQYSTNPSMCLRDFMLSDTYGVGLWVKPEDIDEDSFKEVADKCDSLVTYAQSDGSLVTTKRYELNMIIDQKQKAWDWIDSILATFGGYFVISKGKISLKMEEASPIRYKFNETNINELTIASMSIDDCPNRYIISFVCPENNWQTAKAIVDNSADQKRRAKIIPKEVQLDGVTSQNQALRLGRFYRDYNDICSVSYSWTTGYQAMHLSPGDVVLVNYKKSVCNQPVRITEIKETEKGEFKLTGRPYNASIYNDNLGASVQVFNYSNATVSFGKVPPVTGVNATQDYYIDSTGTVHSTATVKWAQSQFALGKTYNVYKRIGSGQWDFAINTPATEYTCPVNVNDSVTFKIVVKPDSGELSDVAESQTITITGKDIPPSPVSGMYAYLNGTNITIEWQKSTEPDLKSYEVEANGLHYQTLNTAYVVPAINGANRITVRACDFGGNKAEGVTTYVSADLSPGPILDFHGSSSEGYIALSWKNQPNVDYYQLAGSWNTKVYGCSVLIPVTATGQYSYSLKAINEYGYSSATCSVSVTSTNVGNTILKADLFDGATCSDKCLFKSGKTFKDFSCKMSDMTKISYQYDGHLEKENMYE